MKKAAVWVMVVTLITTSQAVLVDDFESYGVGNVSGTGVWTGIFAGTGNAQIETDGSNQYGSWWAANNGPRGMWRTLPTAIANTDTATTVFLQVKTDTLTNDGSFGLSDITTAPSDSFPWGDFEVQGGIVNGAFIARNAGSIVDLNYAVNAGQWYNVWFVIDNSADTYDMYVNTGGNATAADLLADDFVFRNSGGGLVSNDLTLLLAAANTRANPEKFHWDNIAVTSGVNLTAVPEPATLMLLGLGGLALLRRKN